MKNAQTNAELIKAVGPILDGVPVYLGFLEVAKMTPKRDSQGEQVYDEETGAPLSITASSVRNYWYLDLDRGEPNLMPAPDAAVIRNQEVLPMWKESTIKEWIPERQGPGNHTWGSLRRGNRRGRGDEASES